MARIVVQNGNIAWDGKPGRGGHVMFVLHWLEGLRRLGHDVLYCERMTGNPESTARFAEVMQRWWSPSLAAGLRDDGRSVWGLGKEEVMHFASRADALLTLGAPYTAEPPLWLADVRPRVLVEQDPGFSHLWAEDDPARLFGNQDFYFTVGGNIGLPNCAIPTLGIEWRHTWNPVVLDWWHPTRSASGAFSSVGDLWGQGYQIFDGRVYGPKAVELERFLTLPVDTGLEFRLAIADPEKDPIANELKANGWNLDAASVVTSDEFAYRHYVQSSLAEFSVAKGLYAGGSTGWFSDRSACYLAAAKPVVVQSTGCQRLLPSGEGLFQVATLEEAVSAAEDVVRNYEQHSAAARALAERHFSSDVVIRKLLGSIGLPDERVLTSAS